MGIPTPFSDKVEGGKMQASSPPVITPNRSQSNLDDMITLPRPIQSVGMDLHDVSGTSGDWKATALNAEVWVETVTEGGRRFMAAWRKEEADAARYRQEKREATRLGTLLSQTGV